MQIDNIKINGGNTTFANEIVNGKPVELNTLDLTKIESEEKDWKECGKLRLHSDIKELVERYQEARKRVSGRNNKNQIINEVLCIFREHLDKEIKRFNELADTLEKLKK